MKQKILNNLYLTVDYDYKTEKEKIVGHQFFLIATLPLLIKFTQKKQQIVKLKVREEIESNDPDLRSLVGKKASEETRDKYKPLVEKLVDRLSDALAKCIESKKWAGIKTESISIVNLDEENKEKSGQAERENA